MDITWTALTIGFALWLAAFSLQLADLGTARFDARRLARGKATSVRLHPVAWVVPVAALGVLVVGVGVIVLVSFVFSGAWLLVALISAILIALLVAAWFAVTDAATRPAADSYRAIRDELVDLGGTRVWQEWLDELRDRLDSIDADTTPATAAAEVSAGSAARWVIRRPQRALAPLLSVVVLVLACVAAAANPVQLWVVPLALAALIVSVLLAVASAHASLTLFAGSA